MITPSQRYPSPYYSASDVSASPNGIALPSAGETKVSFVNLKGDTFGITLMSTDLHHAPYIVQASQSSGLFHRPRS